MAANGTFGGTDLGDYCWIVDPDIRYKHAVHEIPRASGVIIQDMGGGTKQLTVRVYRSTTDRKTLVNDFTTLLEGFGSAAATLIVDGAALGDWYCTGGSMQDITIGVWYAYMPITFVKSV